MSRLTDPKWWLGQTDAQKARKQRALDDYRQTRDDMRTTADEYREARQRSKDEKAARRAEKDAARQARLEEDTRS